MRNTYVHQGDVFNRWTVTDPETRLGGRHAAICRCECGSVRTVSLHNLVSGKSGSCGCWKRDHPSRYKHGVGNDYYLYRLWSSIKKRCYCATNKDYHNYGGRGITVFDPWIPDYQRFAADVLEEIGERPVGLTFDRINANGNYEPGNIRWADYHTQRLNRR